MAILTKIGVVLIVIAIVVPLIAYFAFALPGQVQYNRTFGGEVSITEDQPTTSGMSSGLMKIWVKMNSTFGKDNHDSIYNSAFYWDNTPDNSLASEDRYFRSEIQRLDNYTATYKSYSQAGVKTVTGLPLIDWYTQIVNNSRQELQRNGGLDWAIQGAWLIRFAPLTYWFNFYAPIFAIILLALAAVCIFIASRRENN